ncbi:MAG: tRNA (adenosine(37)-N6)-dimethylallyltransferase MiaA [Bacteroidetes bacterium]|nr:tRNA (adenosine(37)-N6)-dimethylallyltransferase MiaA [Bacteroidota bacterium]
MVIVGPTAVGKTNFAIQLAQIFNTKIISADSRQCYKELNIGVAKPSSKELQTVYHYFINSHSIHQEVNAGLFEKYALQCAEEIFKENNIAVMVGGTGLYIKTFCEGIDEMPNIPAFVRNNIIQQYNQNGLSWLQNEVKIKDNFFWQTAEQQNPQRLMRALEIITATGKSITNFKQNKKIKRPFNIIKIGLELSKEELYNNINNRVDIMMNDGLLNEVKSLIQFKNLNALQTVGYKELFNYLDDNCNLQQAVNQIKINTRHYAKRQLTWFKKDTAIQWHNAATVNANLVASLLK